MFLHPKLVFLILSVLLLNINFVTSQSIQPVFRNYTTDLGLPSPEIYDILEDQEGYIWFSSDNGVSRFDGYTFENFGPEEGLKNNVVFYLQEDNKGRIWMNTLSGNIYYYERDSIYPYAYNHILESYKRKQETLIKTYVDAKGTMHASVTELGFIQIDSLGKVKEIAQELPCITVLYPVEQTVLENFIQPKTKLDTVYGATCKYEWYTRGHYPIAIYANDSIKILQLPSKKAETISRGRSIQLKDKTLLFFLEPQAYLIRRAKLIGQVAYPYQVSSFLEIGEQLYLGNEDRGGLSIFKNGFSLVEGDYEHYLNSYTVSHVLRDRVDGLWYSTTENGVFYSPPNQDFKILNAKEGLVEDNVTAFTFKNENELFIGQKNGAIFLWNQKEAHLSKLPTTRFDGEVNALFYDTTKQELWKGAKQLQVLRKGRWIPTTWNDTIRGYRANKAFHLYPGKDTIIGSNSGDGGISFVQRSDNKITSIPPGAFGRTFEVFVDYSDRIWMGRIDGLYQYINDSTILQPDLPDESLKIRIEDINQLKDSTLVFGSKGAGVLLWKDDYFLQINKKDGLTSDMIETIHIDGDQNIWAGTLNGLNKISVLKDSLAIETFDIISGLPSNEIKDIDSWGNQVWVATPKGLVKIDKPSQKNTNSPSPRIIEILVNNTPIKAEDLKILAHNKNNLKISFLTINYKLNGKILYRYRSRPGIAWNYTDYTTIDYTLLAPGAYAFEVQSKNEDGFWSRSAIIQFTIQAPYWRKAWFWLLVIGLSILLVFLYYQNRIDQLQKKAWMEREINSLKQSALRAQMNPHFIFNCLNSIQRTIVEGDRVRGADYLAYFAQLIRLIMDSMSQERIALNHELQIIENYLELEKMRTKNKFKYTINVDNALDIKKVQIPPLLVQPYVENAIIHGLIDTKEGGLIEVNYTKEAEQLVIQIKDNGIGITESKRRKSGQHKLHKSVGMTIPIKRLKLLDPDSSYEKVRIIESTDIKGNIQGTAVTIRLNLILRKE